MPRDRKIVPILINAAIFILLEIAALNMLRHNSELQNLWLSRMSHTFMAKVWGGSDNLRHYFSLNKENERLAQENAVLNQQLKEYRDRDDQAYGDSLAAEFKAYGDFVFTPATIVKISRNKQHNYFIINKGSEDGVRPQSGIITNRGVVGIIDAVDKHYSYGLSFMNSDISVSSRIGKEGAVGPLSWDGVSVDKAVLKEIPLQFKYDGVADGNSITVKAGKKWIAAEYDSEPREIILIADKLPETGETITIQIVDEAKHKVSYDVTIPGM